MKTLLTPWLALLTLTAIPASAELDFTLHHKAITADAISVDQIFITDGPSKIYLHVLPEWKVFNVAQVLECTPTFANSTVRLQHSPASKPLTIDQAGSRELLQQAMSQLPPEAKNVVALPVEFNPLPIFQWNTMEVTFRYEYFGQAMRRSVMYLGMLPDRLVQMTIIAQDADFDKLHKEARQLMASWFEPSRDLPPDLQRKYEAPQFGGS